MGGEGYGAGGGSSGYSAGYGFGGSGANGVIILQYADVMPVPLPVALPLLVATLGGQGFAARRRKTA